MNQKVNPAVAAALAAAVVLCLIFIGMKVFHGGVGGDTGSEGKAVIVKPSNPNDPKFTEHLPAGIGGGGMAGK